MAIVCLGSMRNHANYVMRWSGHGSAIISDDQTDVGHRFLPELNGRLQANNGFWYQARRGTVSGFSNDWYEANPLSEAGNKRLQPEQNRPL